MYLAIYLSPLSGGTSQHPIHGHVGNMGVKKSKLKMYLISLLLDYSKTFLIIIQQFNCGL